MNAPKWLTIPQAAKLAGVPERTMRRRLAYLQRERGGILRRFGPGKRLVSAEALRRAFEDDPDLHDAELAGVAARLDDHEKKILALRSAHRSLKARVKRIDSAIKTDPESDNSGHNRPRSAASQ